MTIRLPLPDDNKLRDAFTMVLNSLIIVDREDQGNARKAITFIYQTIMDIGKAVARNNERLNQLEKIQPQLDELEHLLRRFYDEQDITLDGE